MGIGGVTITINTATGVMLIELVLCGLFLLMDQFPYPILKGVFVLLIHMYFGVEFLYFHFQFIDPIDVID